MMKTLTEFDGMTLRNAFRVQNELIAIRKKAEQQPTETPPPATASEAAPVVTEIAPPVESATPAEPAAPVSVFVKFNVKTRVDLENDKLALRESIREDFSKSLAETNKNLGEKVTHLLNAIDVVDDRRLKDLRRVVVFSLAEGEKMPAHGRKMGEHFYLPEYLPSGRPERRPGRDRGFGKSRGGRYGGGRDRKRGDRSERGPRPVSNRS